MFADDLIGIREIPFWTVWPFVAAVGIGAIGTVRWILRRPR
jgi:hypothetical protein